tara:strand:- start:589 stop:1071 length:483 start_codon:yes stop_codon:yes gene_type:complete
MHVLQHKWTLWYHNLSNQDWTLNGYSKIYDIHSVEDFWNIHLRLNLNIIQSGMFFLMKDDILPLWEDEKNIEGGCWSYKIPKKDSYNSWIEIAMAVCGEYLIMNDNSNIINGISISPKKSFCIIKIWNNKIVKDNMLLSKNIYNLNKDTCLYKAHKERNK